MRQFACTWSNLLKNCISADFLLIVVLVQSALRKELFIALFVERINTVTDFGKVLMRDFASTWSNLLKHCISADFLLTVALVQNALRKELFMALFVERLKAATLGNLTDQFF